MIELHSKAESLVLLDHHKTALELSSLEYCHLDMTKSGGRLAWEYFFPDEAITWQVRYTEDMDLWLWKQPYSKEVSAALASYPYDFEIWDGLEAHQMISDGSAINRYKNKIVDVHLGNKFFVNFEGHKIPCINASTLGSEIGDVIDVGFPFSMTWFYDGRINRYRYSLRSAADGMDVSEIAKKWGGGGHPHAAGFQADYPPQFLGYQR